MALFRKPQDEVVEVNPYHFWAARFWHGMLFGAWVRLLLRNRLRIGLTKWGLAFTVTYCHDHQLAVAAAARAVAIGRHIERTQIKDAPIFIIGHWRSGTTLLHELLVLDGRYTYPTTYQCLAPNHFLISEWLVTKFKFLLPAKRPMDNMVTGWDRPQEDEFALCNMGLPSPYLTMAFPNEPPQCPGSLTLEGLSQRRARSLEGRAGMVLEARHAAQPQAHHSQIAAAHGAHQGAGSSCFPMPASCTSCAIPTPLFGSTVKLWKTLYKFQALQDANHRGPRRVCVFLASKQMYRLLRARPGADRSGAILRGALRRPGARSDRADAGACTITSDWASSKLPCPSCTNTSTTSKTIAPARTRSPTSCAKDRPPLGSVHAQVRLLPTGQRGDHRLAAR